MRPAFKVVLVSLVIVGILLPLSADPALMPSATANHEMARFSSYSQLVSFVQAEPTTICDYTSRTGFTTALPVTSPTTGMDTVTAASSTAHSATNVQVQGVDELDTFKTDGQYIYTITNNTLVIVKAYPTNEAGVVAKVTPNGTLTGVFIYGNNLVLIGGEANSPPIEYVTSIYSSPGISYPYYWYPPSTRLWVYDISNAASPVQTFSLQENGTYVGSRLIDNSVYLITTNYASVHNQTVTENGMLVQNATVNLPSRRVNGQLETTPASQIYHSNIQDYYYSYTTVDRVLLSSSPSVDSESFLISSSGALYVSTSNIYLTATLWTCQEETVIHRINITHDAISYEATGTIPGRVMNQFSMDENQGFFRVATSTWQYAPIRVLLMSASSTQSVAPGPSTNVYVLNMDLRTVGSIEGISPGETFYAARFLGDRAYLVTFQRVDPLFVVDLRDPYHPRLLGQLQITGVSDYLQPYDENHLIGFGKASVNVTWENAALFQGLKLTLFDVSDPTHPIDISDFLAGDRGSDSLALTDSHAILFDRSLNLLVIPVEIAQISGTPTYQWEYGTPVWQGAYVFSISPSGGIVFRGGITHLPNGELPNWNNTDHFVNRSLYIGNVLYTLSPAMIRMNSLTDLTALGDINL